MSREHILDRWLSEILKTPNFTRVSLAGDASFRRYHRVFAEGSQYVVMDAPPPEQPKIFADIALLLEKQGLIVPRILSAEFDHGFLLLSDFGDRLYLNELNEITADKLYRDAFDALLKIQTCQAPVPVLDGAFIKRQFGIFEDWYLKKHKLLSMSEENQEILAPFYALIAKTLEEQPQVFVHRDYHSRNLMILENDNPGILDFQDAMKGPITYDLVSLLQDCYISWPRASVEAWVSDFQMRAEQHGILKPDLEPAKFMRWFDWTGLQRHLKNLGIFARLHYRDGKSGYLKDIPQVLRYISETCHRYEELLPLWAFLSNLPETEEA